MDWWLASFFIGAILSLFLPIVPDIFVLFALLLLFISFFYYFSHLNYFFQLNCFFQLSRALRLSSGLFLGASWMLFNAYTFQQLWQDNNVNALELSAKPQWITGQVLSLHSPQQQKNSIAEKAPLANQQLRFNFNVTHINEQKLNKAIQMRLSWKKATLALQQGQTALLKAKFKPSHGLANLGGFSYQTWLNSKSISATGYVINHKNNQLLTVNKTIRQQLFSDYKKLLYKSDSKFNSTFDHELAPLLLALGFGSRSDLNQDLWQVLQATGTGHLIAISGLHIGLVATGSYFFIMLLVQLLPLSRFANSQQLQQFNSRYLAIGLSMAVALSYGYLAGFSLPTIRALVMISLYWCMRLLAIKISIKRWLLLTLFLITLTTPFSLFTASFWLSVYAVTVIFLTLWRFKSALSTGQPWWRFIKGLVVIQLSLTLMLLPISAVFFQQISVLSLLANIIAVPWMSFISIPLCLLSVFLMPISEVLSQFFIMLCLETLQLLWYYLSYLSTQSWAEIALSSIQVQLLVLAGLLSVVLLFFQPNHIFNVRHMLTLFCALFIVIGISSFTGQVNKKSKNWQLIVFDVGQGLSVLIQRQHRAILYDTGASYASGFNMVEAVVLPYLQHANIKQLDKVIISHSDNDHAGGLAILQQSITITELIYNINKDKDSSVCLQGKTAYWQGLTLEMLWPPTVVGEKNNDSCVLLISDGKHMVLLTGDISKKVEAKLIEEYPKLNVDVLVVPHHGSKTSSSAVFISHINPQLAIVSSGFLNRWRMPVADVVKRYQESNIQLLNSAESGQIIINFSEKGITRQTYRDDLWPFWFASAP
ncbi:MAG: DNA internalization-related competence protein ComEC/Rec2 [Colwellia sp.]|nr:DNA internalization-related competence protein ComEC/Rec2 [Colwellia sp.]